MYIKLNLTKCSSKYLCILLWGRIEGTLELDTFCRGDLSRLPLCCTFLHNMDLFSLVVAKILNAWSLLHFNALWDGFLLLKRCFKIINQNKKIQLSLAFVRFYWFCSPSWMTWLTIHSGELRKFSAQSGKAKRVRSYAVYLFKRQRSKLH